MSHGLSVPFGGAVIEVSRDEDLLALTTEAVLIVARPLDRTQPTGDFANFLERHGSRDLRSRALDWLTSEKPQIHTILPTGGLVSAPFHYAILAFLADDASRTALIEAVLREAEHYHIASLSLPMLRIMVGDTRQAQETAEAHMAAVVKHIKEPSRSLKRVCTSIPAANLGAFMEYTECVRALRRRF